ncbi:hypothetical protein BpHYR1_037582 [Brachionus plicatilis]|uniref:Uncharacterized protein n=1 Tax=Brachionus plicatilis TaxID=10195 RepID=A0A3M7QGJ1_BRAPC|nr:hypothetical protein BpHYR1_037582 [Brachionus plicatilis]
MVLVPYRTKSRFGVCSWSSEQRFTSFLQAYFTIEWKRTSQPHGL